MNDSELEDQLRSLRPAAPSPELGQRIARELAAVNGAPCAGVIVRPARDAGHTWRWLRDLAWACAGAGVALVSATLLSPSEKAPQPLASAPVPVERADAFEPEGTTHELLAARDSDQLLDTADGLVREVRYSFRERHAWTNPRTGARMEIEVPREDVHLLPVSLQ
jgi:hypothetical protein